MSTKTEVTIEDLYKVDGKAELVNGEIVHMPPTGYSPSCAGGEIFVSLREYARRTKSGRAITDNAAFVACRDLKRQPPMRLIVRAGCSK